MFKKNIYMIVELETSNVCVTVKSNKIKLYKCSKKRWGHEDSFADCRFSLRKLSFFQQLTTKRHPVTWVCNSWRRQEVNSYPFIDAKLQSQGHMNLGVTMHTHLLITIKRPKKFLKVTSSCWWLADSVVLETSCITNLFWQITQKTNTDSFLPNMTKVTRSSKC